MIRRSLQTDRRGKAKTMAYAIMCPYMKTIKDGLEMSCECARFRFPDKQARRDVIYGVCAHPTAWQTCTFKLVLDKYYYERKYSGENRV